VFIIPEIIISLIKALTKCFISDFDSILTLINTFRVFSIVKIFFFNISPIDFVYAINNFFITGLTFLRFFIN
jgi:hypothetical protein